MFKTRFPTAYPTVGVIGISSEELRWIRVLVGLLRHSDPSTPELARQALLYLAESAGEPALPSASARVRARNARTSKP